MSKFKFKKIVSHQWFPAVVPRGKFQGYSLAPKGLKFQSSGLGSFDQQSGSSFSGRIFLTLNSLTPHTGLIPIPRCVGVSLVTLGPRETKILRSCKILVMLGLIYRLQLLTVSVVVMNATFTEFKSHLCNTFAFVRQGSSDLILCRVHKGTGSQLVVVWAGKYPGARADSGFYWVLIKLLSMCTATGCQGSLYSWPSHT